MSVSISSACWALQLPASEKLVLLCLADFADDQGVCWPGLELLTERTGLGERTVREQLKRLESAGLVQRERRVGQSAVYRVTVGAVSTTDQAQTAPSASPDQACSDRQHLPEQPAPFAGSTGTICQINRQNLPVQPADLAGSLRSITDPPLIRHRSTKRAPARNPDWVDPDAWSAFVENRRAQRAPFTERAAELIVSKLAQLRDQGHDPNACLLQSVERGWRGVFPVKELNHGTDRQRPEPRSLLDRVRAACDEQQARFEALAANGRALRPQVVEPDGHGAHRAVVEGRFRVV